MQIQISEKYRIVSEERCWCVQAYCGVYKSGPETGRVKYKSAGWFVELEAAVKYLARRMVHDVDASTVTEALAGVSRVAAEIERALGGWTVGILAVRPRESVPGDDNYPVVYGKPGENLEPL